MNLDLFNHLPINFLLQNTLGFHLDSGLKDWDFSIHRISTERFSFEMINIQPGTELTFVKDENQKCKVLDDRFVEFREEKMTLSGSALIIINEMGYDWNRIHGPAYWELEGQNLHKLRMSLDN